MAFKAQATSGDTTKRYFWLGADWGQSIRVWVYVTPDSASTVAASGYITEQGLLDTIKTGDLLFLMEVGSISDSREIIEDINTGGLVDVTLHMVTLNTGTTIDLSDDLILPDGAVTTAKLADNAVTLAKITGATAGDVLYWDSNGDPQFLAVGTDGHPLLLSSGIPSWGQLTGTGLAAGSVSMAKLGDIRPTRSDVTSLTIDSGVNEIVTSGYSSVGDGGGAHYKRVGMEPSHNLKVQSADGAWWELFPEGGVISVRQAGATGDGVTDDSQAFLDALAGVEDFNTVGVNDAVHTVLVPPGDYDMATTTLELKKRVRLVGGGSGQPGIQPAKLTWDANVTGIIVHREDTTGATTEMTGTGAADGSTIEGLHLVSAGGTIAGVTDDTLGHGIWLRARAVLRNLLIEDFPGNGVHIVATSGGAAAVEGNANLWRAENISMSGCHKNGFWVDGADVNAGTGIGIDARNCGRAGIWDSSFLGNTYVGCHVDGNGFANKGENGSGESSIVHYNDGTDKHFIAAEGATEAELVATTPGTEATVWIHVADAGSVTNVPTWTSSQPEGTFFVGGPYITDNANAQNVLINCYLENHYPQYVLPTQIIGGHRQDRAQGEYVSIQAGVNNIEMDGGLWRFLSGLRIEDDTGPELVLKAATDTGRIRYEDADAIVIEPPNSGNKHVWVYADSFTAIGRFRFKVANGNLDVVGSGGTTGGSGSAGAGSQYVEMEINGTVYKVLHDGTV